MKNIFLFLVDEKILPEFPLIPASRGFCITLKKTLVTFKQVLVKEGLLQLSYVPEIEDLPVFSEDAECSLQIQPKKVDLDNRRKEAEDSSSHSTSNGEPTKMSHSLSSTCSPTSVTNETKKDTSERNTS